jgi:hypothetical protein
VLYVGGGVIRRTRRRVPKAPLTGARWSPRYGPGAFPTATRCTWACPGVRPVAAVGALQKSDLLRHLVPVSTTVTGKLDSPHPTR